MEGRNLETLLKEAGGPLNLLRGNKIHRAKNPLTNPWHTMPCLVNAEWNGLVSEARAYRNAVAVVDLTHHMTNVSITGPDTIKFLNGIACNNLSKSVKDKVHHMVAVNKQGQLIGDGQLFHEAGDELIYVGVQFLSDWIMYQASITDCNITARLDERSPGYPNGRAHSRNFWRFHIQGPNGPALLEKVNGGRIDVNYFHGADIKVGKYPGRALQQNFTNSPIEIWGPFEDRDEVRAILLEEGREFGCVFSGQAAHKQLPVETGWLPHPLPAIYTSEDTKGFREWLTDDGWEASVNLRGSFSSDNIEDFYVTPYEIGMGKLVRFTPESGDFYGREALEAIDPTTRRKRAILEWNSDDLAELLNLLVHPGGEKYKFVDLSSGLRTFSSVYDKLTIDNKLAGISHSSGFNTNERKFLSVGFVDYDLQIGDELVVHWGEAGGGVGDFEEKATEMFPIRVKIAPVPYPLTPIA